MAAKKPDDDREKTTVLHGEQTTLNREIQTAKEQEACLIIIRGTPQGHRFFLAQPEMTIGRDSSAEIVLANDPSISRKHAKVSKEGGKCRFSDLSSVNGSYVNDRKLSPGESVILEKEDMIKLGSSILKFLPAGELEILFYGNLSSAAYTDPLTGIYNRGYLLEAMEAEFKRAKALHTDLSLIYFDLDHFKKINDSHGHDAGDFVLREFTAIIRSAYIRPKDAFARFGGEEFVILLGNTNAKTATEIAEQIRTAVETHAFVYEGKRLPVTCSLGVAELRSDIESANTLLKLADKGLYAAKSSGRNRVCVAS